MNFIVRSGVYESLSTSITTLYSCDYQASQFNPHLFTQLDIFLPETLQQAWPKRQAAYLAGRYCTAQAMRHHNQCVQQVPMGADRSIQWPLGVVGSIAHSDSKVFAVIGRQQEVALLGVDYEPYLSDKALDTVREVIRCPDEAYQRHDLSMQSSMWLTLLFAAKEAFFKALAPRIGCYIDFQAVRMVQVDVHRQLFCLELAHDLSVMYPKGARFMGHYRCTNQGVLTLMSQAHLNKHQHVQTDD
jgi:enterobactin synthetase component D